MKATQQAVELRDDPATSYALGNAIDSLFNRDPLDAYSDALTLAQLCALRLTEVGIPREVCEYRPDMEEITLEPHHSEAGASGSDIEELTLPLIDGVDIRLDATTTALRCAINNHPMSDEQFNDAVRGAMLDMLVALGVIKPPGHGETFKQEQMDLYKDLPDFLKRQSGDPDEQ